MLHSTEAVGDNQNSFSSMQGVMEAITALHGTKTILIVAHRLSTVEHCDRLYRLEAGIQRITQVENNSATNLRQAENLNS